MENKRYAIVRVDDRCPVENEEEIYLIDRVKMFPCFNDKRLSCKNCRYGDTKEQLILKVAQAIKRVTNDGYVVAYKKFGTGYINTTLNIKDVAKEIVEFLGVNK